MGRIQNHKVLGKDTEIALLIGGEDDGKFDEGQYVAYNSLMDNWEKIQHNILQPILNYYKQKGMSLVMMLHLMKIIH